MNLDCHGAMGPRRPNAHRHGIHAEGRSSSQQQSRARPSPLQNRAPLSPWSAALLGTLVRVADQGEGLIVALHTARARSVLDDVRAPLPNNYYVLLHYYLTSASRPQVLRPHGGER